MRLSRAPGVKWHLALALLLPVGGGGVGCTSPRQQGTWTAEVRAVPCYDARGNEYVVVGVVVPPQGNPPIPSAYRISTTPGRQELVAQATLVAGPPRPGDLYEPYRSLDFTASGLREGERIRVPGLMRMFSILDPSGEVYIGSREFIGSAGTHNAGIGLLINPDRLRRVGSGKARDKGVE